MHLFLIVVIVISTSQVLGNNTRLQDDRRQTVDVSVLQGLPHRPITGEPQG